MFIQLNQQVWDVAMLLATVFALWKGGTAERIVGVANVVASVASRFGEDLGHWLQPQWAILGVDVAFLVLLVWLALASRRTWLLFAAAFQLLGVVVHAAMMVDHKVSPWAYITGGVIFSYLVLVALAVGTWAHWRRSRLETVATPH